MWVAALQRPSMIKIIVTEETDALGQKELEQIMIAISRVTSITDKRGFTTGFDYDAHGNIQVVTDKTGLKSHLEYDKNDNLTKVTGCPWRCNNLWLRQHG